MAKEAKKKKTQKVIFDFGEIQVLNGRYGPYIKKDKDNFRIPKGVETATLDKEACEEIISQGEPTSRRRRK